MKLFYEKIRKYVKYVKYITYFKENAGLHMVTKSLCTKNVLIHLN